MFCRKCGKEIPNDSEFCPKCGAAVEDSIKTAQKETERVNIDKSAVAFDRAVTSEPIPDILSPTRFSEPKPKSSKKTAAIVLSIIGIVAVIVVIITVFAVNNANAHHEFEYHLGSDGTYTIDKYVGNDVNITIPDTINGNPVTAIGKDAFFRDNYLESITFGKNIAEIGESAFLEARNLKTVTFTYNENSLMLNIGYRAFYDCSALSEVSFPENNIINIADEAFLNCRSLKKIDLINVMAAGDFAFYLSGIESVNIGGKLGKATFDGCASLKEVTLRTTDITPMLFKDCTSLETVNWNINIYKENTIPDDAFVGCKSLKEINLNGFTATYPAQLNEIIADFKSLGAFDIKYSSDTFKDCPNFKKSTSTKPSTSTTPSTSQTTANTAVDISKLTYAQIVEKFGMPEYYTNYGTGMYEDLDMEIGYSTRVYSNGQSCFNKNNNTRIDYVLLYGDKTTIVNGSMHLGEELGYYNQFMNFDVYDALEMGAGYINLTWYEVKYQVTKNGNVQYYATLRFLPDTYTCYAVKIEYVGY